MCRGLDAVLRSHRIGNPSAVPAPPTQPDLLTTSSAHFAGGAATARALEESVGELNYTGHTANNLVMLVQTVLGRCLEVLRIDYVKHFIIQSSVLRVELPVSWHTNLLHCPDGVKGAPTHKFITRSYCIVSQPCNSSFHTVYACCIN